MAQPATARPSTRAPTIVLVVAAAENGVIGHAGHIPWHIGADLRRFRAITMGKPVIMGRKTYQSIGKPLSGRTNIVLSRAPFAAEGIHVAGNLADALALAAKAGDEAMVIGGAEIYREALPMAARIELTRVRLRPAGDAFFADPAPAHWREVSREDHERQGDTPAYSFSSYVRIGR